MHASFVYLGSGNGGVNAGGKAVVHGAWGVCGWLEDVAGGRGKGRGKGPWEKAEFGGLDCGITVHDVAGAGGTYGSDYGSGERAGDEDG